jgi:hypothetical protein
VVGFGVFHRSIFGSCCWRDYFSIVGTGKRETILKYEEIFSYNYNDGVVSVEKKVGGKETYYLTVTSLGRKTIAILTPVDLRAIAFKFKKLHESIVAKKLKGE